MNISLSASLSYQLAPPPLPPLRPPPERRELEDRPELDDREDDLDELDELLRVFLGSVTVRSW